MRSPDLRAASYGKKVESRILKDQSAHFRSAVNRQVEIECSIQAMTCFKTAGLFRPYLIIFAKEICSRKERMSGALLTAEIGILRAKWITRGVNSDCLDDIINWCVGTYVAPTPPVTCDWLYRRKITFSGYTGATDLNDFPVLVHLTGANFNFAHAQASGQDIRFMTDTTCPGDGTPLKHEIEKWDAVGEDAFVWVKIPTITGGSNTDYIYIFYGNAAVADGQDAENVWDSDYIGVYHCNTVFDSTAYGNNITNNGMTINISGAIDSSLATGSGKYGVITDTADHRFTGDFSVSAIVTPTRHSTSEAWFNKDSGASGRILFDNYPSPYNKVRYVIRVPGLAEVSANSVSTFSDNDNVFIELQRSGSKMLGFFAGVKEVDTAVNNGAMNFNKDWGVCATTVGTYYMIGYIDEIRISKTLRSADYVLADFKTKTETLQTYGAEESA